MSNNNNNAATHIIDNGNFENTNNTINNPSNVQTLTVTATKKHTKSSINFIPRDKVYENSEDSEKRALPFLNKYERTRLVGMRATQIADGAQPVVDYSSLTNVTPVNIAQLELEQKKIPFLIERTYPDGYVEYWNIENLTMV